MSVKAPRAGEQRSDLVGNMKRARRTAPALRTAMLTRQHPLAGGCRGGAGTAGTRSHSDTETGIHCNHRLPSTHIAPAV